MSIADIQADTGAVMTKTATVAVYGGSAGAIFGGLSANDVAAIGGIVIGIAGLLISWYYKYKHYQLAVRKAEAAVDADEECPP